jgi:DNA-binding NarL/FixJ family response regulator
MSRAPGDPHTGGMENNVTPRGVFIVEDSRIVRERLTSLMGEIEGVSVVGEADNPQDAVDGILRTRPDWVLLDIQLIGGTGLEVLLRTRTQVPCTRFIVLTQLDNAQYRRICLQDGADYFFEKTQTTAVRDLIAGHHSRKAT